MVTPKLQSLLIRDFRSISGEWTVPLDAEIVLIHGQNGAGKTSLLSALELAATGKISYLDRLGDRGYLNHLNHRGTRSGEVRLEVTGSLERLIGSAHVSDNGVDSDALLTDQLAEAFVERCLLPQATLSRLFEVYAPKQATAETPLIRFVNEVLGLDALDSLIDGLHPAGDVRRVQKLSSRWREATARHKELSDLQREAVPKREELQGRFDALKADLVTNIGIAPEVVDDPRKLRTAVNEFEASQTVNDSREAEIRALILQLEAVDATLRSENLLNVDPNELDARSDLSVAEDRYAEWQESRSGPLVEWFKKNVHAEANTNEPHPPELLRALRSALLHLESSLDESKNGLARLMDVEKSLADRHARDVEIDGALRQLAEERENVSRGSAAAGLASVLVSLLEHVDSEVCPVCDQDFGGTGSLRSHLSAKVEGLNADATRLVEMEQRRTQLEAEQTILRTQISAEKAVLVQLGDQSALISRLRDHADELRRLKALEPSGQAGLLLWDTLNKVRDADSESVRRQKLLEQCLADIERLAGMLGVNPPRGLLSQQTAALRAVARGQLDELEPIRRRISAAVNLRNELIDVSTKLMRSSKDAVELASQQAELSAQIADATARKQSALDLRKRAEELRAAITTRVFNDQLNGAWARIFGALVPSEPFVPQFRNLSSETRRVQIDLETRHRDGLEGATPAAMLSQGNLNTAALSLFIALHFAVQPRLPWLIFDDPVQSMDDLHISNFASLVKQLTRRNGRQVLIAVHDRELFDYLTLELSPASPDQELLAVTLDRTYGQSVVSDERLSFQADTSLSPSPAA